MSTYKLQIDSEFKSLIAPLDSTERRMLEENLVRDGCREPLSVWNDTILDGHNRYEICCRRNIPFKIVQVAVNSRDEAIAWICVNQLGRRNISEETRRYLIGKRYGIEKVIGAHNSTGKNQHNSRNEVRARILPEPHGDHTAARTRDRIGKEYHISHATVLKYENYTQALDTLSQVVPDLVNKILSGQVKISQENIMELAKYAPSEIERLSKHLATGEETLHTYSNTRRVFPPRKEPPQIELPPTTGAIKNMPAFDPDAEVSSLTLTIPSWISTIKRTKQSAKLNEVTSVAKGKLDKGLLELREVIDEMLAAITEETK